jgi:hypothetical protein
MRTMTTVAMGGITLKDNETGTLLQAVATAMAPLNVLLAPHHCTTRKAKISRNLLNQTKFLFSVNIIQ